jgi:hypothetical protein
MSANCTFSIANYGSYKVKATEVNYGMEIVAEQDVGRRRKAFYVTRMIASGFTITLKFSTEALHLNFSQWLMNYAKLLIQPGSTVGSVVVSVPSRKFLQSGIPTNAITFESKVANVGPEVALEFVGTKDWLTVREKEAYSKFLPFSKLALAFNPQIQYFYPAGTQLSGTAYGNDYLYDAPLPDIAPSVLDLQEEHGRY